MPVTSVISDIDTRTLTITADFHAPLERVWAIYSDARQLEQVWGPPTHPATFVDHEFAVGTRTTYFMTGPEGEKYCGYWDITGIDEPNGFTFDDGFAHEDFTPNTDLPVSKNSYTFVTVGEDTRATFTSTYESAEALQQVLAMGMQEGATQAINQVDEFLARHP